VLFLASDLPLNLEQHLAETGLPLRNAPLHYSRFGINCLEDLVSALALETDGARQLAQGAALITDDDELGEAFAFHMKSMGAIAGPFDSFLVLRGVKTLALRMQRHSENAFALAQWLERHPKVARVHYPGLESHPQHALAKRQMQGFGGMVSVTLATDLAGSRRFLEACEVFSLAESLGGVESLIEHPALMTHATIPAEQRAQLGISDALVRLSVGVEDLADQRADLEGALARI
jgi:cystathionine gamma-lyase